MSTFWSFVKGLLRKQYRGAWRPRSKYRRTTPFTRLRFEELEVRVVPASYSWTGGANTLNWGDAANWSGNVVPGSGDDVTISKSGIGTITIAGTQSVRTLNDTTAALSIASGGSLSLAAVAANSTFGQNVTVASGATLAVGASASVLLQAGVTLTDNGTLSFASSDVVTFGATNDFATEQVVVGSGGLLNASGTTFTASTTNNSGLITVNSGGQLAPSGCTFQLPLFLPAVNVANLGGASSNVSFQDINIVAGTLSSGEVDLNAIGTSTTNLRYVFSGAFTIASGATLNVAASLPVLLDPGVTVTDNG
ncbi:MAG TPA: hypothetical protein VKA46_25785, partial [Gemmataceae bacterium]|nr:hypothetical protein [Gemmataceae bacterium]